MWSLFRASIRLIVVTGGTETQTAFQGLTASGRDAAHRSYARDMPRVVRKEMDLARRAGGSLQRNDIMCDDLSPDFC